MKTGIKLNVVVFVCNPIRKDFDAGRWDVQGYP